MSPTISVIVPVYNVCNYVADSINSIVEAGRLFCTEYSDRTFEIIAVDDGSTDGSSEVLDKCAMSVSAQSGAVNLIVIHQTNAGVAKARQVGLERASGEYIAWVDPDDWVEKEYYLRLYATALSSQADIVACDMIRNEDEKTFCIAQPFDNDVDSYIMANLSGVVMGSLCNKLFRAAFIRKYDVKFPATDCETMEDLYFICALLLHKPQVHYLPEAYYHYVLRRGSLITQPFTDRFVVRWQRSIRLLEGLFPDNRFADIFYLKKARLKSGIYSHPSVSDKTLYEFCPEVKSLIGKEFPLHHRVLFYMAVNFHCRSAILHVLTLFRFIRKGYVK